MSHFTTIFENIEKNTHIVVSTSQVTSDQKAEYVMVVGQLNNTRQKLPEILVIHTDTSLKTACLNHEKAVLLVRLNRSSVRKSKDAIRNAIFN